MTPWKFRGLRYVWRGRPPPDDLHSTLATGGAADPWLKLAGRNAHDQTPELGQA